MKAQIKCSEGIVMSDEAIDLFIQLTDATELLHHTDIERHLIIDKLRNTDRELMNTANEDLKRIRESRKVIKEKE